MNLPVKNIKPFTVATIVTITFSAAGEQSALGANPRERATHECTVSDFG
jgi:hypothetical protein